MEDPNFYNLFSAQTRYSFYETWQAVNAGEELHGEEKVVGELMQQHPELYDTWDNADKIAFMHIVIDSIVVNQITQDTSPDVADAHDRLREQGLSHLEAIHEIDLIFVQELWPVLKHPFNAKRYAKKVGTL